MKGSHIAALLITLLLLLPGCITWQKTSRATLQGFYATANTGAAVGKPMMHDKCMDAMAACAKVNDAVCQPLILCQEQKSLFTKTIVSALRAVMMGLFAVEAADKNETAVWLVNGAGFIEQLRLLAKANGLDAGLSPRK